MKITGYERIDSNKDGKSTHGVVLHRRISCNRLNCAGFKTSSTFISDDVLRDSGLDMGDIVSAFSDEKDFVVETIQNGTFTQVVNLLIL